jgi:hypothetical protein
MPPCGICPDCEYGHVLDDLEAAMQAYREAREAVVEAERGLVEVKAGVPAARRKVADAIVRAAAAGARQRDIVRITGYNREQVRRITRAGGVEADE